MAGAAKKGALPLRPLLFQPCWEEEEEGAVEACYCDRGTMGETPPRSAEEADEDPALDSADIDFRGIFGGSTSAVQERRSKPRASWLGQSQAR